MINDLGPGFVLTTACLTAGFTLFYFLKASHTERMAKIARGTLDEDGGHRRRSYFEIKLGMLMGGIGLGLLLALTVENMAVVRDASVLYPALMFICGGFSLLVSYFLIAQLQEKD